MSVLKKLIADGDTLPPAQVIIDGANVKQVVNSDNEILWGKYSITNSVNAASFFSNYCKSFNIKFIDSTNTGEVVAGVAANRNYSLNTSNVGYHGEDIECRYTLQTPYYYTIDTSTNSWINSYYGINSITKDFDIKAYSEDFTQTWPVLNCGVKNGNLAIASITNLSLSNATRLSSSYGKATTGNISSGSKVYYGDIIQATWTHSANGKLPISGRQYTFELKGDGVDTSGNVTQDVTNFKNQYLFLNNQPVVLTPVELNYPLFFYSTPSWLTNTNGGYYFTGGLVTHHALLRGEKIPLWLCSSTETFNISGVGITTGNLTSQNTTDYRRYATYDTSVPLYSGDIISRSNGNPFKNENGYSLVSTTFSSSHSSLSGNKVISKPTHCYIAYIYNNKVYKMDFLNNSVGLVTFTPSLNTSGAWLEANNSWNYLQITYPKLTVTAPLNLSGTYEVIITANIYDANKALVHTENFTKTGSFVRLTSPINLLYNETVNFSNYNLVVSAKHSGNCTAVYKIYDANKNLIHTGSTSWSYSDISNYW